LDLRNNGERAKNGKPDGEDLRRNNTGTNYLAICDLYRLRSIFTSKCFATHVPLVLIQVLVPLWEALLHSSADDERGESKPRSFSRSEIVKNLTEGRKEPRPAPE
jgi:hypothetical protein